MERMIQKEVKLSSDELKTLTEAVSAQTKVSNRAWFALIALALIVVLPTVEPNQSVAMPFGLPEVPPTEFYTFALPFLTVLMVSFCQAYAQEVRSCRLAQHLIDKSDTTGELHPRDVLDLLRVPSVNRVAPLPQLLSGQFYSLPNTANVNANVRLIAVIYYAFLKVLSTLVYLGLPVIALVSAFIKFREVIRETIFLQSVEVISYAFVGLAFIAFFQVVILEIIYLGGAAKAILQGNTKCGIES